MAKDPGSDSLWRCTCGNDENLMTVAHCQDCGKRRWSQLGISRKIALMLIDRLRGFAEAA